MTDDHHRGRRAAVVTLLLVGALLTPVALLADWARDTITSTDGYVAAVEELTADPAVRSALVDHLTSATLEQIDADALVSSALEPFVRDGVAWVVDSDAFADAWAQANRGVHTRALALLRDDDDALSLGADGQVSLDLAPVVDLARAELAARGIPFPAQVDASVPLFSSQELVSARTSYTVLDAVAGWLPWVVALLLGAAVALARSRAVVLAWEAGMVAVGTALAGLAVVVARSTYLDSVTGSPLRTELTGAAAHLLGDSALGALRAGYVLGAALGVGAVGVWLVSRRLSRRRTPAVGSTHDPLTTARPGPRTAQG